MWNPSFFFFMTATHMGTRRKAREAALQFLFQDDFPRENELTLVNIDERFEQFCQLFQVNKKARTYTMALLQCTVKNRHHIDDLISQCAKNWRLERIAVADRNLLRIGVSEMLYSEDVPHQVAINEAVEIAKRYGSDESPSFVNGILDAVKNLINS